MKNNIKNKINLTTLFCLAICLIVFIFFAHTIGYSWKHFDENIIFQETILPIPKSFSEIFEIISSFGLNQHFVASNPFYSNISNLRSDPINSFILLFIYYFFKANSFAYHFLSLTLHIFNTMLLFVLLNRTSNHYIKGSISSDKIKLILVSALTLLWALHPSNVEPVLFATNWTALLTYFFCFIVFYFAGALNTATKLYKCLVFALFLITVFTLEHSFTLPFIVFFYYFSLYKFQNQDSQFKEVIKHTLQKTVPLFLALMIFILYIFLSHMKGNLFPTNTNSLTIVLERIFWLSPQIFLHFLKLILFPLHLSIDQTALVKLSKTLFEPYSILCCTFSCIFLLFLLISFFLTKKRGFFLYFVSFSSFFLAMLPFLHIISPIYNLASERYLYFPLFFLVLGSSHLIFFIFSQYKSIVCNTSILVILSLLLFISSSRAYLRTFDWKDSFTLLTAAIRTAPNGLFKGLRQEMLATSIKTFESNVLQSNTKQYTQKALVSLKKALVEFERERKEYQDKIPEIIKFYGLDPRTITAKTAFLIAFCDYDLNNDYTRAYKILSPYIYDLEILDSQILNFYYRTLFNTKKIDEAENLLTKSLKQNRISSTLFVALSDLYEYKYNDLRQTKKYLNLSFKYFPYDPLTLFGLKRLYMIQGNAEQFAFYSYLYGLRTHDLSSFKEATYAYIVINKKEKAKIILKKIFKYYPIDEETLKLKSKYEEVFGKLEL